MEYRPLGRTGFQTSVLGLGGESALYERSQKAVDIILRALRLGINYFDTAPLYAESEYNYGEVLPAYRDSMFIATKVDERGYDAAWRQFEASLGRLNVDSVDLLQIHHLDRPDEVEAIFRKDGVVRMLQEARDEGLVRFLGVTGHTDPRVLLEAIRRFPFDAILLALNPADPHVHSFQRELLPEAVRQDLGIMAMKVFSRGLLLEATGWGADTALRYVLTLPVSNAVVGVMNQDQLARNVAIASAFQPLSAETMKRLERTTIPYAREINFYRKGVDGDFPTPPKMMEETR